MDHENGEESSGTSASDATHDQKAFSWTVVIVYAVVTAITFIALLLVMRSLGRRPLNLNEALVPGRWDASLLLVAGDDRTKALSIEQSRARPQLSYDNVRLFAVSRSDGPAGRSDAEYPPQVTNQGVDTRRL